ncbi:FeFe-hydrogenase assembly protein HydG [Spironucleus salmonicida]|uniref:FeFe-hydrogenase assembly protein HydG n=1 Tax=Spironucleus salmonicida TaxID=348837 RepID=K7REK4_9EUKA|nr:FeFe-hydrogenase assembly protein HydG [Spironucleus salmonicida]KAH0570029.1 FeFe-hydrogenase assembly protein HydG [Spironucleus salmonicida]|eukprot:EST42561.1 [FeFe]-hydrogenase assembly protein HydG [Spironucleus salmonicida]
MHQYNMPKYAETYKFTGSWWSPEKEALYLPTANTIVNQGEIFKVLEQGKKKSDDAAYIANVIDAALDRASLKSKAACELKDEFVQGLKLEEASALLNCDYKKHPELREKLYAAALDVKRRIYGDRVVLFAPIYTANFCSNSCLYCGFRGANAELERVAVSDKELSLDVEALLEEGHKRAVMLCGEHPRYKFDDFLRQVNVAGDVRDSKGSDLRRINVEIPPLSLHDFKRLKNEGNKVGTFLNFQETYHKPSYEKFHESGPKADYQNRISVFHRSLLGGLDDIGLGVLYGLYDYKFDTLAMIAHANHLNDTMGVGPHTISVPRIRPANNAPVSENVPYPVNDDQFKDLVAILRLSVPYTGMILSTRENQQMRKDLLNLGISQLSAGSATDPGGYAARKGNKKSTAQFSLEDERPLQDVVQSLIEDGFLPSQCTSCYGLGRTGETFMSWAKTGDIQNYCLPNSLITLQEYMEDYGSKEVKNLGAKLIKEQLEVIDDKKRLKATKNILKQVKESGLRGKLF